MARLKSWVYTSNNATEMALVHRLLNERGIEAEMGPFSDEPELAGELAVLVDDDRYEEAGRIVAVFYEERARMNAEAEARRARERYGWLWWVVLGVAVIPAAHFGLVFVAICVASIGSIAWLIRCDVRHRLNRGN